MSIFRSVKEMVFAPPDWVNTKLKPGHTSLSAIYGKNNWLLGYSPLSFIKSPNMVWFIITLIFYRACPYDFDKAAVLDLAWIRQRIVINVIFVNLYYAFWHITLYAWHWSKRKFNPDNGGPSKSRLIHNMWYTNLGTLQWTMWEVLFVHCYATNKIGYVSDEQIRSSPIMELTKLAFWVMVVPFYREVQFYFAHRFIHFRVLYKYVHSLHHRNADIEPYSGMAMHPVEHIYYIGCVGLSLWIHASPLVLLWNGVHLLITPAASHSGWEDHYMSDQHHFIHHAKFECNYGTGGIPMDKWFGTYREKLGKTSESYRGHFKDDGSAEREVGEAVHDSNSGAADKKYLNGDISLRVIFPEKIDQMIYNLLNLFPLAVFGEALRRQRIMFGNKDSVPSSSSLLNDREIAIVGMIVAVGPIAFAYILGVLFPDKKHSLWPFHKDSKLNLSFHVLMNILIAVLPVYHFVISVLSDEGSHSIPYQYLYG